MTAAARQAQALPDGWIFAALDNVAVHDPQGAPFSCASRRSMCRTTVSHRVDVTAGGRWVLSLAMAGELHAKAGRESVVQGMGDVGLLRVGGGDHTSSRPCTPTSATSVLPPPRASHGPSRHI